MKVRNRLNQDHTAKLTSWLIQNKSRLETQETSFTDLAKEASLSLKLKQPSGSGVEIQDATVSRICKTVGIAVKLTPRAENAQRSRAGALRREVEELKELCLLLVAAISTANHNFCSKQSNPLLAGDDKKKFNSMVLKLKKEVAQRKTDDSGDE